MQRAEEAEVLLRREFFVQRERLRSDPDARSRGDLGGRADAFELDRAAVRLQQPDAQPHGGGLAGAVGAEEAEHLAAPDLEIEGIDRHDLAVGLANAREAKHGGHYTPGDGRRLRVSSAGRARSAPRTGFSDGGRPLASREPPRAAHRPPGWRRLRGRATGRLRGPPLPGSRDGCRGRDSRGSAPPCAPASAARAARWSLGPGERTPPAARRDRSALLHRARRRTRRSAAPRLDRPRARPAPRATDRARSIRQTTMGSWLPLVLSVR